MTPAEAIGRMVRTLRRGMYSRTRLDRGQESGILDRAAVVDVTAIYDGWIANDDEFGLYEEGVMRPPLNDALYCWQNGHGNTVCVSALTVHRDTDPGWERLRWTPLPPATHDVDWDLVEWVTSFGFFIGGRSEGLPLPTVGPAAIVVAAINADGVAQDYRWIMAGPEIEELISFDLAVVVKAVTFLNCRNVIVMEPTGRPRPVRRAIERTGVTVNEIHVTPIGKSRLGREPVPLSTTGPLSMVRGHVARYGPRWGRGLLFGKLEGEYWIGQHTRGSAEAGVVEHDYVTEGAGDDR